MPAANCIQCGASFHRAPSHIKPSGLTFCSSACYHAHRSVGFIENGYRRLTIKGRHVQEHRLIMERQLGRKVPPSWVVHHKDGDRSNNSLANLVVMDRGAHTRMHLQLKLDFERAKAMRDEGLGFKKIAIELGVHARTIQRAFVNRGLHIPVKVTLTWSLEQAKAMRAKGFSFRKIGGELGVTHASVRSAFIGRGLR